MSRGTVLMMAGGTGGHVFPALAVAGELAQSGFAVQWLGSRRGIENSLVPEAGYPLHALEVRGLRGGGLARTLMAPLMLLRAVLSAVVLVRRLRPVLAVGFGGYASGPGGLAARLNGVPLVLHEQNARSGLTNRLLARVATRVLQAFPGAFADAEVVGNPVRAGIFSLAPPAERLISHQGPLRLLVLGGSQGALALNRDLPPALADYLGTSRKDAVVIRHQCGRDRQEEVRQAYEKTGLSVSIEEFIRAMDDAYQWADLVICRAGALTVSEVAAAGVAAVFVPLPTAVDDHQTLNARWLADQQAGRLLPQSSLNRDGLAGVLDELMNREALAGMAARARSMARPDSAARVAAICEEVLHG